MIKANLKRDNKGFSLVELTLLVAMTACLAAFSIPMLTSSMHSMQLASDARNIATTMTYAKLSATSQFTQYKMTFDVTGTQWRMERRNMNTGDFELQQDVKQLSRGVANSEITFKSSSGTAPRDGYPTESSQTITFDPRGVPLQGMSVIYLTDNVDDYAVSVSLSGKVELWRYFNDQWITQ